jgi:hypothetical protein
MADAPASAAKAWMVKEALKKGMEEKSREVTEKGAEPYAKA